MADTWRETGRFLTPAELDGLSEVELTDYMNRSSVRDLSEIDDMPEPYRTTFKAMVADIVGRHEGRRAAS